MKYFALLVVVGFVIVTPSPAAELNVTVQAEKNSHALSRVTASGPARIEASTTARESATAQTVVDALGKTNVTIDNEAFRGRGEVRARLHAVDGLIQGRITNQAHGGQSRQRLDAEAHCGGRLDLEQTNIARLGIADSEVHGAARGGSAQLSSTTLAEQGQATSRLRGGAVGNGSRFGGELITDARRENASGNLFGSAESSESDSAEVTALGVARGSRAHSDVIIDTTGSRSQAAVHFFAN